MKTQTEMAYHLKINVTLLSKYENGARPIPDKVMALADRLAKKIKHKVEL
jgi:hypothetical protein